MHFPGSCCYGNASDSDWTRIAHTAGPTYADFYEPTRPGKRRAAARTSAKDDRDEDDEGEGDEDEEGEDEEDDDDDEEDAGEGEEDQGEATTKRASLLDDDDAEDMALDASDVVGKETSSMVGWCGWSRLNGRGAAPIDRIAARGAPATDPRKHSQARGRECRRQALEAQGRGPCRPSFVFVFFVSMGSQVRSLLANPRRRARIGRPTVSWRSISSSNAPPRFVCDRRPTPRSGRTHTPSLPLAFFLVYDTQTVPVITEEVTRTLEDIIKARILDVSGRSGCRHGPSSLAATGGPAPLPHAPHPHLHLPTTTPAPTTRPPAPTPPRTRANACVCVSVGAAGKPDRNCLMTWSGVRRRRPSRSVALATAS